MSKSIMIIELAYKDEKVKLTVPEGTTIQAALKNNAWYQHYLTEVTEPHLGIFGKVVTPEHVLKAGERIELYFPLLCDPMQKRKNKVKK